MLEARLWIEAAETTAAMKERAGKRGGEGRDGRGRVRSGDDARHKRERRKTYQ